MELIGQCDARARHLRLLNESAYINSREPSPYTWYGPLPDNDGRPVLIAHHQRGAWTHWNLWEEWTPSHKGTPDWFNPLTGLRKDTQLLDSNEFSLEEIEMALEMLG